jgi:nitric oxide synthase oxygenase domain/subunit
MLHLSQAAGVRMTDHHTVAQAHVRFEEDARAGSHR